MALRSPKTYAEHRARCAALRTAYSALLAVAVVWLPTLIQFVQRGQITRVEMIDLARSLLIAVLIVLLNYAQRLKEREQPRRRRHHRRPSDTLKP